MAGLTRRQPGAARLQPVGVRVGAHGEAQLSQALGVGGVLELAGVASQLQRQPLGIDALGLDVGQGASAGCRAGPGRPGRARRGRTSRCSSRRFQSIRRHDARLAPSDGQRLGDSQSRAMRVPPVPRPSPRTLSRWDSGRRRLARRRASDCIHAEAGPLHIRPAGQLTSAGSARRQRGGSPAGSTAWGRGAGQGLVEQQGQRSGAAAGCRRRGRPGGTRRPARWRRSCRPRWAAACLRCTRWRGQLQRLAGQRELGLGQRPLGVAGRRAFQ